MKKRQRGVTLRVADVESAVTLARDIRADILREYKDRKRDLAGHCGLAAIRLAIAIGDPDSLRFGVFMRRELFMGKRGRYPNCHAWNVVGDHIVDITATQFGSYRAIHVVRQNATIAYIETANGLQALETMTEDWELHRIDAYQTHLRRFRAMARLAA